MTTVTPCCTRLSTARVMWLSGLLQSRLGTSILLRRYLRFKIGQVLWDTGRLHPRRQISSTEPHRRREGDRLLLLCPLRKKKSNMCLQVDLGCLHLRADLSLRTTHGPNICEEPKVENFREKFCCQSSIKLISSWNRVRSDDVFNR
jgi:hypothetical protein